MTFADININLHINILQVLVSCHIRYYYNFCFEWWANCNCFWVV